MANEPGRTPETYTLGELAVKIARLETMQTSLDGLPEKVSQLQMKMAVMQTKMASIVFGVALVATVLGNVLARAF